MNIYLRILKFVKPYKLVVFVSLISSFLFVLMNAFSLWMISTLISTIMIQGEKNSPPEIVNEGLYYKLEVFAQNLIGNGSQIEQLKMLCFLLLASFILKNIFYYLNNIALSYVKNRLITDIRNKLFEHLNKLSLSFYHKNKSGEISTILLRDVATMRVAFTETIQHLINEPISLFILVGMLFIISTKLALITLLGVPISAFLIVKLGQSIRRKAMRSSKQIAGVTNILLETIHGIRIVKAFAMSKVETLKFKTENQKYFKLLFKQDIIKFLTAPTNDLIGVSIGVALLWIGGQEVLITKSLDSEGFIRFIFYLFGMMQPARKLGGVNANIQAGIASAERVFTIFDTKPEIKNISNPKIINGLSHSIRFNNISFTYEMGNSAALKNINVEIPKGKTIALIGKSGAGKSTFVDMVLRFFDPTQGQIYIDNENIKNIDINSLRSQIGFVTQETILFNDSIANNIGYGKPSANIDEIIKAAKSANAIDFIEALPDNFDTKIGEKGMMLSGGQRQRISIARAILKNPEILIMDEATSSLDSDSEAKVQKALDNLINDRTVLVIAHRLSTIINADKILVFQNGQIVEEGNHNQLLKKNGEYSNLFKLQYSR